jgi:ubiquinone/menaquinone biosynthesis C-methylase UbiE
MTRKSPVESDGSDTCRRFSGKLGWENLKGESLASKPAEFAQLTYDKVAEGYDDLWSRHVVVPNEKLTRLLRLSPGDRVADVACGTGVDTLAMARRVAPGEVVAVDYSEGMLAAARERADSAGFTLTVEHAKAEDFIARVAPRSFDVVSMRFLLTYIDWRDVLPRTGRMLRQGGRVGVLTSTTKSAPQFYELFDRFRGSFDPVWKLYKHCGKDIGETWRQLRTLRETFVDGTFISVPESAEQVAARLAQGGLVPTETWTEHIRLWFENGLDAVHWIRNSGYATHHSLDEVGPEAVAFLEKLFASGMENFREDRGIPLDLVIAGVVAERKR